MPCPKLVCRTCLWTTEAVTSKTCPLANIRTHLLKTHVDTALCDICCKTFQSRNHLNAHMKHFHLRSNMSACKICGKVVTARLQQHMLIHEEKRLKCPHCPKMFRIKGNLSTHLKYHLAERPFPCELCGQGFARKQNYQRHMKKHKQNDYHLLIG